MKAVAYLFSLSSLCFALHALALVLTYEATAASLALYTVLTLLTAYAALLVSDAEPPRSPEPFFSEEEEHHRQCVCDCLKHQSSRRPQ